jgi:putative hydrolase of the HAD superfamily
MPLSIIGVDADDTLWHTETVFRLTHKRFNELLSDFADEDALEAKIAAIERENMKTYGYGAKGFTLSMLQTALEVSNGNVSTKVIQELLSAGREMMTHPIEPLPRGGSAEGFKERGRLSSSPRATSSTRKQTAASGPARTSGSNRSRKREVLLLSPAMAVRRDIADDRQPVKSDILPMLPQAAMQRWFPTRWSGARTAEKPEATMRYREIEAGGLPWWTSQLSAAPSADIVRQITAE